MKSSSKFALLFASMLTVICSDVIAESMTLECSYSTVSDGKSVEEQKTPEVFKFVIDGDSRKAYMLGNQGAEEVNVVSNNEGLSFVEITESGNVITTTIAENGKSVHSRHIIFFGVPMFSQYYGECAES